MPSERTIINALIIGASLLFAPFLISSILTGDFWPVYILASLGVLLGFSLLRERLSMLPLISLSIFCTFSFLPLRLVPMNLFCIALIAYYFITWVALKQRAIHFGRKILLVPILIITAIVLIHDHNFGTRLMNSTTEGARPAALIILAVVAYICGINLPNPPGNFMRRVPIYCVICGAISMIPYLLTTVSPGLAPNIYLISNTINYEAYRGSISSAAPDSGGAIGRLGEFSSLGLGVELFLVAYFPITTWWRPNRWWVPVLAMICLALVLASGFRNALFAFIITFLLALWCYSSWKSLTLSACVSVGMLAGVYIVVMNIDTSRLDRLPLIAQRTLSFLPGPWAQEAKYSAKISDEFRKNIQDVYIREYLHKSPLLGNGFSFDADEYDRLNAMLQQGDLDHYYQAKVFITAKMPHTGWISVYDIVGVVGSAAFVFLGLAEVGIAWKFIFGPHTNRGSPLFPFYVWLFCSIASTMIGFFVTFGDFGTTFSTLCIYGIALAQLEQAVSLARTKRDLPMHDEDKGTPDHALPLSTSHAGRER